MSTDGTSARVDVQFSLSCQVPISYQSPPAREAGPMGEPAPDLTVYPAARGGKYRDQEYPHGTVSHVRFPSSPTVGEVCAASRERTARLIEAGERSPRTAEEYEVAAEELLGAFGAERAVASLRPADFAVLRADLAGRLSLSTLKKRIGMIRTVLGYAHDLRDAAGEPRFSGAIDYGREFDRPDAKAIRRQKASATTPVFAPDDVRRLLDAAGQSLRTMILLGVNCGFGNTDIARLRWECLDLESGWTQHPRSKTGVERICPLWGRTREALREHRQRLFRTEAGELVFRTRGGHPWVRSTPHKHKPGKRTKQDDLAKAFLKLRERAGIAKRVGFYGLRHTFATAADEAKDPVAVNAIMGHADGSIPGQYRHGISEDRLRAVIDAVEDRLFGEG